MKKVLALVLSLVLLVSVAGVAAAAKVGVAMPTQSLQRWNQDGAYMKEKLEAAGFEVDLQYANNEVATQVSQIENMLLGGAEVLVIASIDGSALGTVLATAKDMDVPVIAYDRLLTDTPDVSYYTTFDNYGVGTIQGTFLKEYFDLDNVSGPLSMEIFCGDPGDNNAGLFYQGAIDVLMPYIESGVIVVPSGQTEFEQCATKDWNSANAQARMDNLLAGYYSGGEALDMVMCSNDSTAQGVTASLLAAGFEAGENFPIITGQDCDIVSMKNMLKGTQAMSVFKDTRTLAEQTVAMVSSLMAGEEPELNAEYDNHVFMVPSFNCTPVFADLSNYEALLIDSGYYTMDALTD